MCLDPGAVLSWLWGQQKRAKKKRLPNLRPGEEKLRAERAVNGVSLVGGGEGWRVALGRETEMCPKAKESHNPILTSRRAVKKRKEKKACRSLREGNHRLIPPSGIDTCSSLAEVLPLLTHHHRQCHTSGTQFEFPPFFIQPILHQRLVPFKLGQQSRDPQYVLGVLGKCLHPL